MKTKVLGIILSAAILTGCASVEGTSLGILAVRDNPVEVAKRCAKRADLGYAIQTGDKLAKQGDKIAGAVGSTIGGAVGKSIGVVQDAGVFVYNLVDVAVRADDNAEVEQLCRETTKGKQ